ncbi:uncharacterized protein K460DRAFT_403289 [Cucurbitaria berberidis CBS 394.84]|uniref:F-box domain-containing protein n=1 Tax=Cucurbitaria berberidis CBS 394.84 TaxID=1168544 RepID=A0A9P4GKG7_9PLEO|nr:uncharacterized protein K460DRAFT_403289 [Cucurbitaria berberidis CBS 394.84]KAF1847978.1 hypothetical protein K460DRAFT_403289 [Cucurbitaria berberidis CBS 394.84]
MPSLLTIPRELRDQICTYALFAQTNERQALNQTFEQLIDNRKSSPAVLDLLQINHQLRAETIENIKLFAKRATYDLDIILVDEILLLPTWVRVPFLTNRLEEVNATFRISGSFDPKKEKPRRKKGEDDPPLGPYVRFGSYKGFRIGSGAGPAMGWQIYGVLERFIRAGPIGHCTERNDHRHVAVKTLNINIETPPDIDASRFLEAPRTVQWRHYSNPVDDDDDKDVLDPDYLVDFIRGRLYGLLNGSDHEWFSYGKILYEHVDEVVMKKDGVQIRRFDVAKMLRNVQGLEERYVTKKQLRKYKEMVWRVRKERGLKVLSS